MNNENYLTKKDLVRIIKDSAEKLNIDIDGHVLSEAGNIYRHYDPNDLNEFIRDLNELASKTGIMFIKKEVNHDDFSLFIENFDAPTMVFMEIDENMIPAVIQTTKKSGKTVELLMENETRILDFDDVPLQEYYCNGRGEIIFLTMFNQEKIGANLNESEDAGLHPVKRLFNLISADKRDVFYVYIYALIIGGLSLILPLGIQAAIELVAGGVFFSSIYLLIGIVILGVLGSGILQVLQITIVEYLQRRVFVKAAFEFAYRVPRIKMEAVLNLHFPELMNRFFDVMTLQKGLPKLLIDLSTGVIQILFGLILLSFYHPFFVFFGFALLVILFLIFYFTGPKGLESSIQESQYKYKAVHWLEELARSLYSFKLSGTTDLPLSKTDLYVNNYLRFRKRHFRVLVSQYSYVLLFKAFITAGLLIIGTVLVVQREITLGQFVASEVVIILILSSVEKIIMYMDVVYDMLTAVDKIAHVTDLPLEQTGGLDLNIGRNEGFKVEIKEMSYTYPDSSRPSIQNINLSLEKGERICVSGMGGSGKTTLVNTIAGMYSKFDGIITYDGYSLRDLDRVHLRDRIGKNVNAEDIFEGTILDNILVGKPYLSDQDALHAIEEVGLSDEINRLPNGLQTIMVSGGKGFSVTFIQKIILARCLAKKPNMLILSDYFKSFPKNERLRLLQAITDHTKPWTLIVVSNDPMVMAACDRVVYMQNGKIIAEGPIAEVLSLEEVVENIN